MIHFFEDRDDYFAKTVLRNALAIFVAPKREEGRAPLPPPIFGGLQSPASLLQHLCIKFKQVNDNIMTQS